MPACLPRVQWEVRYNDIWFFQVAPETHCTLILLLDKFLSSILSLFAYPPSQGKKNLKVIHRKETGDRPMALESLH